jgi:hypothetical protein
MMLGGGFEIVLLENVHWPVIALTATGGIERPVPVIVTVSAI